MGITSQAALELVLRARDEATATVKRFNDALGETEGATEGAGDSADGLAGIMDGLGLAITAAGVIAAAGAAYEFGRLGAEAKRTDDRFVAFSGSSEEAEANLAALEEATRGAVSEQTLMAEGAIFLQTGLAKDTEEMAKLVGMSMTLGKANETAQEKISNFSLMLLNTSVPRMDSYGMSGGRARARILELQSSIEGLTREEAFKIAVMEQGAEAMARLGDAAEDDLLAFERLEASADNLKVALAESASEGVAAIARGLTEAADAAIILVQWSDQVTGAIAAQEEVLADTSETYEEYVDGMLEALVVSGRFDEALASNAREGLLAAETNAELAETLGLTSRAMFDIQDAAVAASDADIILTQSMADAAAEAAALSDAADPAAESLDGLATSASKVAKSFGEMEFDDQSLWDMAVASGASVEALSALATQLDIATDAEIQASMAGFRLTEAFGAGLISAEEYAAGMANVQTEMWAAGVAATDMTGDMESLADSLDPAATAAHRLAGGAEGAGIALNAAAVAAGEAESGLRNVQGTGDEAATSLGGVEGSARRAQDALAAIERSITININYKEGRRPAGVSGGVQELQHGGTALGGLALVGEAGPELVVLPRGTGVFDAQKTKGMLGGGGVTFYETVVIQDQASMAMFLRSRTEDSLRRLSDQVMG